MQISQLKLTNFRNYDNHTFLFSNNKNIVIGNNGVGKTNIVEAIYYLALTKSFRTSLDNVIIKDSVDYSIIEGSVINKISNNFKIIIEKNTKRVFVDNNQVRRLSDYISLINIVCFSSEDLKLIKDSPSVHRQLINIEISQLDNQYLKSLAIYNKILKQRNAYLKKISLKSSNNQEYLHILTDKLIDYGLVVYETRKKFINEINKYLNKNFKKITNKEGLSLDYKSDYQDLFKDEIVSKYQKVLNNDITYGNTSFGIHLDDFIFVFQDNIAKNYLSEGEQKNAIIAFKLAELKVFHEKNGSYPIFILDDLFSLLDKTKIKKILKFLNNQNQIFITTTDLENIDADTLKNSKVFNIKNNKIEEKVYE